MGLGKRPIDKYLLQCGGLTIKHYWGEDAARRLDPTLPLPKECPYVLMAQHSFQT